MNESQLILRMKEMLTPQRFQHSIGVKEAAEALARRYGYDMHKAGIAGLLHDCAKDIDDEGLLQLCRNFDIVVDDIHKVDPQLLHGPVGAVMAQKTFDIDDDEIVEAIHYHTLGKEQMRVLTKIIYLADYIEPHRCFNGVQELRSLAFDGLDQAVLEAINQTIRYVIAKDGLIHPQSIMARNYLLINEIRKE